MRSYNNLFRKKSEIHTKYSRSPLNRIEKTLIRLMTIAAVVLAIFQINSAGDPLDFYLKVAGNVEMPALAFSEDLQNTGTVEINLIVSPNSPIKIWQNDKVLEVITKENTEIWVDKGTIFFDARNINYPIRVMVYYNEIREEIFLNNDVKSVKVE